MQDFRNFPTVPYQIGQYSRIPFVLSNGQQAILTPIEIDWSKYGASSSRPRMGVDINVVGGVQNAVARIASIYVDNTDSLAAIYVYFPDTKFVAVAGPNQAIVVPVITGQLQCTIYGDGFVTGDLPKTRVFLIDNPVDSFSFEQSGIVFPQWLGSNVIQRTNSFLPGFGPPALGDQLSNKILSFTGPSDTETNIFPNTGGIANWLYITSINIYCSFITSTDPTLIISFFLYDSVVGPGNAIFIGRFSPAKYDVQNLTGFNLRLPALSTWSIQASKSLPLNTDQVNILTYFFYSLNTN